MNAVVEFEQQETASGVVTREEAPSRPWISERYAVIRELGRGATARVFLCTDRRYSRPVAVKLMNPELMATTVPERLLREISILARLSHPNILPLLDSGEIDGCVFYVMPHLGDETLRDRLRTSGAFSLSEALPLLIQIARALDHAHSRGIIHRDVKPSNIIVTEDSCLLADFGIARALDVAQEVPLTSVGSRLGSPAYMSPEQFSSAGEADERSDIYSLACVAFELLTGSPPFDGTPQVMAAKHLTQRPPRIPAVPSEVDRAISRALAKSPEDRFRSAGAFAAAVSSGYAAGTPTRTGPLRPLSVATIGTAAALFLAWVASSRNSATVAEPQVVVAEFRTSLEQPDLEHLGRVARDWVTQALQSAGMLGVVPPETARRAALFVGETPEAPEEHAQQLAAETGAHTVVHGSIRSRGDSLVAQAWITDGPSGREIAQLGPFTAFAAQPSALLPPLAQQIAAVLTVRAGNRLPGEVPMSRHVATPLALRLFDDGLDLYLRGDYERAIRSLVGAYDADSLFVTPLIYASISASNLHDRVRADSILALAESHRVLLPPYYRGWLDYRRAFLEGDRPQALRHIRAVALQAPGSKAVYNWGIEALENGEYEEALEALEGLDPYRGAMRGWLGYWEALGMAHHLLGRHDRELELSHAARSEHPGHSSAIAIAIRAHSALSQPDSVLALLAGVRMQQGEDRRPSLELGLEAGLELAAHGLPDAAETAWRETLVYGQSMTSISDRDRERLSEIALHLGGQPTGDQTPPIPDALPMTVTSHPHRGILLARAGDTASAIALVDRLRADQPRFDQGETHVAIARILAELGRQDEVAALLELAFASGMDRGLWWHRDPILGRR